MNTITKNAVYAFVTLLAGVTITHAAPSIPLGYGGPAPVVYGASFFTPNTPVITNETSHGKVLGASAFTFTRTLTVGSTGDDVTELQKMLARNGFFTVTPTGYFGSVTKKALSKWQQENKIPGTGYFGLLSRMKSNSSNN